MSSYRKKRFRENYLSVYIHTYLLYLNFHSYFCLFYKVPVAPWINCYSGKAGGIISRPQINLGITKAVTLKIQFMGKQVNLCRSFSGPELLKFGAVEHRVTRTTELRGVAIMSFPDTKHSVICCRGNLHIYILNSNT